MFKVNEYIIVFKRVWQERKSSYSNGRYDTKCEIYLHTRETPDFTGIARLHPNDKPDKIVGKKIALRNAMGRLVRRLIDDKVIYEWEWNCAEFYNKEVRTAIWKAFWEWVAAWTWVHP